MRPLVGLDPAHAMLFEGAAAVGEDARALQEGMNDERLEHVQLEVSRGAAEVHRHIVAHHLRAHHGERLGLGRDSPFRA
jgi:hypothetical protein